MKKYLVNKNSDKLLVFFTGWGCDEYEFEHLNSSSDVLILYDYSDLTLDFDFSKYKSFNLLSFSAGVFISSFFEFDFKFEKRIAVSGNPYLFNEKLGLSTKIQTVLCNITEENADDFAKNYLVKTAEEQKIFRHSKRTPDSCKAEFESLKKIYKTNEQNIKDNFDFVLFGEDDKIFNVSAQKDFYGERLHIVKDARHNMFFQIKEYEQILNLDI